VVSRNRPNSSVSAFEIASAHWQSRSVMIKAEIIVGPGQATEQDGRHSPRIVLAKDGERRSGLAARSTHRYRYPGLSSHR
jgi:hypothetical protein